MSPLLKALAVAIAAYTAFTGCIGTFFMFTHEFDRSGMLHSADFRLSLKPHSTSIVNYVATALAVDETVAVERNAVCIDRYKALQGAFTMPELLENYDSIQRNLPPEIRQLKTGRYFLAALLHNNEEVFSFWQRELFKVILMLGNRRFDNIYVSIYESGSSDMTKVCLIGLTRLLTALKIPHRILTDEPLDGMTRIEHLALLRNLALEPVFNTAEEYDQVVYLNDIYFCSSDVIDLVRIVQEKDADMTCSVDYVAREPGMQGQDDIRLYDMWVAHDIKGQNFVNDWPYMCDIDSQAKFDDFQPVRVFSCWNGMVAIKADIFQKLRIRFRAAHQFECKLSECEIVVRDMWALGRDKIVMVPTARTAYDFKVFDALSDRENPGLGRDYDLDLSPIPLPPQATCCPLNDLFHLVRFEECFSDENWKLSYDMLGVALAPNTSAVSAAITLPPDVASLSTHLITSQPADVQKKCLAVSKASKIPTYIVHFAGDPGVVNHDRKNKLAMAALSWMARHPCFTYDMIDDDRLEAIATQRFEAELSQLGFVPNLGIRIDYIRLLFIYENGGLFVPANSWALESLTTKVLPTDNFVLGMATDPQTNSTYMAFLAAERHSPLIKEVLQGALRLLDKPMELAELVRGDDCNGSPDRRERYHTTGMGMLLRTVKKHESEGARFVNYDTNFIQGYVGRPEHICNDMVKIEEEFSGVPPRGPLALRTKGTDGAGGTEKDSSVGLIRSVSFSVLRVSRALFQGQYLPTFFGDLHSVEPSWTTPPITDAELAAAGLTEPPDAVFAYMSEAGELGIYAGLGPLDKSMRLIRTVAKARPGVDAEDCSMVNLVLQDDSNLVLYCEKVDERGRGRLSVLWAAGSSLAPEFRGPKHSFVMLRRDGRLALYPGLHPNSWGYDVPPGPSWKAELEIAQVAGLHGPVKNIETTEADESAKQFADATARQAAAPPDACEDFHVKCELWVSLKECLTNAHFMYAMCKKGCGRCLPPPLPKRGKAGEEGSADDDDASEEESADSSTSTGEEEEGGGWPYGQEPAEEGADVVANPAGVAAAPQAEPAEEPKPVEGAQSAGETKVAESSKEAEVAKNTAVGSGEAGDLSAAAVVPVAAALEATVPLTAAAGEILATAEAGEMLTTAEGGEMAETADAVGENAKEPGAAAETKAARRLEAAQWLLAARRLAAEEVAGVEPIRPAAASATAGEAVAVKAAVLGRVPATPSGLKAPALHVPASLGEMGFEVEEELQMVGGGAEPKLFARKAPLPAPLNVYSGDAEDPLEVLAARDGAVAQGGAWQDLWQRERWQGQQKKRQALGSVNANAATAAA